MKHTGAAALACILLTSQGWWGALAATSCPPGNYLSGSTCAPCPAGTYSAIVSTYSSCVPCPLGTCVTTTGASACTVCSNLNDAAMNYFDYTTTGDSTCACSTYCDSNCGVEVSYSCVGTYCGGGYASPKQIPGNIISDCTLCTAGRYSLGGCSCSACPPGTYTPGTGYSSCIPCPPGSYSAVTGLTACVTCPVNTYMNASGYSFCATCPSGYSPLSGTGNIDCTPPLALTCASGYYISGSACVKCATCANGLYMSGCSGTSAGSCTLCTNNH